MPIPTTGEILTSAIEELRAAPPDDNLRSRFRLRARLLFNHLDADTVRTSLQPLAHERGDVAAALLNEIEVGLVHGHQIAEDAQKAATRTKMLDAIKAKRNAEERAPPGPYARADQASNVVALTPPRSTWSSVVVDEHYPDVEKPIEFAVRPLMLGPGRPCLFVGDGSIGKTFVLQAISLALENGVAGLGGLVPARPAVPTVHVDCDQGLAPTRRRYRRLAAGMELARRTAIVSLYDVINDDSDFHPTKIGKWRSLFARFRFVTIDALAGLLATFDLDENKASDVRKVLNAIAVASEVEQATVNVVAHSGKDLRDDKGRKVQQRDPRGSSAIRHGAGVVWAFTGSKERGATRCASRDRDIADDDGDDELVSSFSFRIEAAPVATPGMRRRDGGEIPGLVVARMGDELEEFVRRPPGRAGDDLRLDILRAIHGGGLRSQNDVCTAVRGEAKLKRDLFKELCRTSLVMHNANGELFVTTEGILVGGLDGSR